MFTDNKNLKDTIIHSEKISQDNKSGIIYMPYVIETAVPSINTNDNFHSSKYDKIVMSELEGVPFYKFEIED